MEFQSNLHFFMFLLLLFPLLPAAMQGGLRRDFYANSCPEAEVIVQSAVGQAVSRNPGIAAGLLRLHFHDCFVRGCDASVLLDSSGKSKAEKDAVANFGLRGFEAIDNAKAQLEDVCPGTVSCADILAYAARDAVFLVGGPHWEVPGGRRDGVVSREDEVATNLPSPLFNVDQLTKSFARKGMTQDEMVTLSGAHTIGVAHCLSFVNRLYNFSTNSPQDPSLDPSTARALKVQCPKGSNFLDPKSKSVALDPLTPNLFDNGYYTTLSLRRGLLTSDHILFTDDATTDSVQNMKDDEAFWRSNFVSAMIKMGFIDVLTRFDFKSDSLSSKM